MKQAGSHGVLSRSFPVLGSVQKKTDTKLCSMKEKIRGFDPQIRSSFGGVSCRKSPEVGARFAKNAGIYRASNINLNWRLGSQFLLLCVIYLFCELTT